MRSGIDFHTLFVRTYSLMIGLQFGLGAVMIAGGRERFSAPSFDGPRDLVAALPYFPPHVYWGLLFLLHGAALVLTMGRRGAIHVLRFGLVVCMFLTIAFLISVFTNPVAALVWVVTYAALGVLFLLLADHLHDRGWTG